MGFEISISVWHHVRVQADQSRSCAAHVVGHRIQTDKLSRVISEYLIMVMIIITGVALTFEKLMIAKAQHGKNCVSSPAAKVTISTDVPKIDKHENTNV